MRPTYERAEDRNRQRTVMGWFCQSYGCSAKELPAFKSVNGSRLWFGRVFAHEYGQES